MKRRVLVPALAMIAVVAVAVPALAQPETVTPQQVKISKRALLKSKLALRIARDAKRGARTAQADAAAALAEAASAKNAAAAAAAAHPHQSSGDVPRIVSASEAATVTASAESGEFEAKGGPSLTATVPSSGLIEVWAQAEIRDEEGGAVALYEDGQKVTGVSSAEFCGDGSALIDVWGGGPGEFTTFATPPIPGLAGCTNAGAPGPVLLSRPPGPHSYELRYAKCSCPGPAEAEFRNRVLRIAPRP